MGAWNQRKMSVRRSVLWKEEGGRTGILAVLHLWSRRDADRGGGRQNPGRNGTWSICQACAPNATSLLMVLFDFLGASLIEENASVWGGGSSMELQRPAPRFDFFSSGLK